MRRWIACCDRAQSSTRICWWSRASPLPTGERDGASPKSDAVDRGRDRASPTDCPPSFLPARFETSHRKHLQRAGGIAARRRINPFRGNRPASRYAGHRTALPLPNPMRASTRVRNCPYCTTHRRRRSGYPIGATRPAIRPSESVSDRRSPLLAVGIATSRSSLSTRLLRAHRSPRELLAPEVRASRRRWTRHLRLF